MDFGGNNAPGGGMYGNGSITGAGETSNPNSSYCNNNAPYDKDSKMAGRKIEVILMPKFL